VLFFPLVPPVPIAVLCSGRGSNLAALIDSLRGEGAPGKVVLVISNRPDALALSVARENGIESAVIAADGQDSRAILELLSTRRVRLVVLAGWVRRVPDAVVREYRECILNIHPALLPAFGGKGLYGHRVHEAVLQSGVRVTGATVHVVDEQYDHGRVVAQWPVPVHEGDTTQTLAARVLAVEHRLLPAAVRAYCDFLNTPQLGATDQTPAWPELSLKTDFFAPSDTPPKLTHALSLA
jgi:formyltetrahydrofolate-dependent phosphoribosylglycinamide formyltransferase